MRQHEDKPWLSVNVNLDFRFESEQEKKEFQEEADDRGVPLAQVIQECIDEQSHVGAAEDGQWMRDNDPDSIMGIMNNIKSLSDQIKGGE